MREIKWIVFFIILVLSINIYATNGPLKQNSIIECNGVYYGKHATPSHWHIATKKNNTWVSVGEEVDLPPCYIKTPNEKEKVSFSKCSDGDTALFIINGVEKKVRFLAIDAPETGGEKGVQKYGKEASTFTCDKLKNANEIYLEYDGASDKEDKYGRILAFVYVDNILLEKSLIENGLAKVEYIYGDYEHVDELRDAEKVAKEKRIGIWEDENALADIPDDNNKDEEDEEKNILLEVFEYIVILINKIFAIVFN